MQREPNYYIARQPKTFAITGHLTGKLFIEFFIQEISLRDRMGRIDFGRSIEQQYGKMLSKQAMNIWETATRLKINPVNIVFIFLNRYYAMFTRENPITKMRYFWEDFLVELSHNSLLISLLNYDEAKKDLINNIIAEIKEAKDSPAFDKFVKQYCKGYKVVFPKHSKERTSMFETILVMLKQLEDSKLDYFVKNHAIHILQAHVWQLSKFGSPIQLYQGNFIGDNAIYRLRAYYDWVKKVGRANTFSGFQGAEF